MTEKIMIEVDPRDALVRHIESLQRTLTKRNETIEALEERLSAEGESEHVKRIRQKAYSEGYTAAASNLQEAARKFGYVLESIQQRSFQVYLRGDKIGWDKEAYEEEANG